MTTSGRPIVALVAESNWRNDQLEHLLQLAGLEIVERTLPSAEQAPRLRHDQLSLIVWTVAMGGMADRVVGAIKMMREQRPQTPLMIVLDRRWDDVIEGIIDDAYVSVVVRPYQAGHLIAELHRVAHHGGAPA